MTKSSLSSYAQLVLSHLREQFHITDHQAKDFYEIDALYLSIEELRAAGHLISETNIPRAGKASPEIKAYTLYIPYSGLSAKVEALTRLDLKIFGGGDVEVLEQIKQIMNAELNESIRFIKADLCKRLGIEGHAVMPTKYRCHQNEKP